MKKLILPSLMILSHICYADIFSNINSLTTQQITTSQKVVKKELDNQKKEREEREEKARLAYLKEINKFQDKLKDEEKLVNTLYDLENKKSLADFKITRDVNFYNYVFLNTKNRTFDCQNHKIKNFKVINTNTSSFNLKNCKEENVVISSLDTPFKNGLNIKKEEDLLNVYNFYIPQKNIESVSLYLNHNYKDYAFTNKIVSHIYCQNNTLNSLQIKNSKDLYFHNCNIEKLYLVNITDKTENTYFINSYVKELISKDSNEDSIYFEDSFVNNLTTTSKLVFKKSGGNLDIKTENYSNTFLNSIFQNVSLNSKNINIENSSISLLKNEEKRCQYFIDTSMLRSGDFTTYNSLFVKSKIITETYTSLGKGVSINSKILSVKGIERIEDLAIDTIYFNVSLNKLEKQETNVINSSLFVSNTENEIESSSFSADKTNFYLKKDYKDSIDYIKEKSDLNAIKSDNEIFKKYREKIK